jgi:UDP-2,3-diacylglucosamine pyrophosphatase LpxH
MPDDHRPLSGTPPEPLRQIRDDFPGVVLRYRSIWISDVHLGTRACQANMLLDFLKHTSSEFLYLVGDIVDGWQLKKRWYWPQAHNDVIQKILRRARHGEQVFFLPGNHDEAARNFCGLHFGGVFVTNEVIHETLRGRRLLILHGDQFDAVMGCAKWLAHLGDTAYEFTLVLNTILNFARHRLGFPYWSLSAYLKRKVKNAVNHISDFEEFIAERARHNKADGVVCGHIHHAEMRDMGTVTYCNDGDWVESCTALVEDMEGNLSIIRWSEDRNMLLEEAKANPPVPREKEMALA